MHGVCGSISSQYTVEDVRDTMVLSRLLRAGQWEHVVAENGGMATANLKHNILQDVLVREIGVEIPKETDHRWSEPLTEERMRYASDNVEHLMLLYHDLLLKVEKDGMLPAYQLLQKVYPIYMRQQARGVPFDAGYEFAAGTLRSLLPLIEKFGIVTAEEVEVDTLAERLREELVASGGV